MTFISVTKMGKSIEEAIHWLQQPEKDKEFNFTQFLKELFGETRFLSLCQKAFGALPTHFSRSNIEELFVKAADIRYQDMKDLFDEIKGNNRTVRYLSDEETQILRTRCSGAVVLEDLGDDELQELVHILLPFQQLEHVFFLNQPSGYYCIDSGKGYFGQRERIHIIERLRQDLMTKLVWRQVMAKWLSNYEMPEGTLLYDQKKRPCYVYKVIAEAGAYKICCRPIGKSGSCFFVYRGTRLNPTATGNIQTFFDDMHPKLGSLGVAATLNATKELLADEKFVSQHKVYGIGMSLGGAHAQRDMIIHKLSKVITVSSPGIDKESCEIFAQDVAHKPKIIHYIDRDDVVDQFGECKLGAGISREKGDVRVEMICTGVVHDAEPLRAQSDSELKMLQEFNSSLSGIHNRITPLAEKEYTVFVYSNKDKSTEALDQILYQRAPLYNPKWEEIRKKLASIIERTKNIVIRMQNNLQETQSLLEQFAETGISFLKGFSFEK